MKKYLLLTIFCWSSLWLISPLGVWADTPVMQPLAFNKPLPHYGDQKLLILLVDFSDKAGIFTGQQWGNTFFGPGGFANYYKEVTYNQLRYSGDVVGLSNGAATVNANQVAYIRLPHPLTYYADNGHGFKVGAGQFPKNNSGVVYHALQALDASGFDFAPYADPQTQRVENLVVIFAGSSFAVTRDEANSLEATAYSLKYGGVNEGYTSKSGHVFDNYTFCPDQRGNLSGQQGYIGICAHEHGHGLGMPDLYDYSYTTSGAGSFDLMAYGNAYSDRPFHFGAFTKQFFGWITPTVLGLGSYTMTLAPSETAASFIKIYPFGNSQATEYFLLENRQPTGFDAEWNDRNLCGGLVIWHVDDTIVKSDQFVGVNSRPPYPNAPAHAGVTVVEADGRQDLTTPPTNYGDCADVWTPSRTWEAKLWNNEAAGITLRVIKQSNNSLQLRILVGQGSLDIEKQLTYLPLVRS